MKSIINMRQCAFSLFATLVLACAIAGPAEAQTAPLVMRMSTATIHDAQHQWMKIFAALVEKASKGRIKAELFPASQLGSVPRAIEGTQFGSIQVFVGPPELLSGVDSRYELLSAPGLFKDFAHANRTLQDPEFNAAFLALGANKGLKGLGLFMSGPVGINTRTPVRKLADLQGKKIRVLASDMQMEQIRRLKATPVPMALGDVVPAMQQGALDGVMTSTPVFTALHFYDVAKYIFESDQEFVTSIAVVSRTWYDKLPPDLQKVVREAGQQASKDVYQWSVDFVETQRKVWIKAGGKFIQPSAAEHAQIMKLMLPIGAEVTANKADEKALYELLMKAAKRTE